MRRVVGIVIVTGIAGAVGFGGYLASLYEQLNHAFSQQEEFIPTRIYSDVTRIAAPERREEVEDRLKGLAYAYQATGDQIRFDLHAIDYPQYLVPENHPVLDAPVRQVTLQFDGEKKGSLLQSIQLGPNEVSDIYLEPELVGTLSRTGETRRDIRAPVKFDAIPANVWKAILSVEDPGFREHGGFSIRGTLRAIWVDIRSRRLAQGGSTITQQLVKNLMERRGKSMFRKLNELFLAILLEAKFDKDQILERYLNEVNLGQIGNFEVHGVVEGAEHFFGKKLEDLNLGEMALMAGLIRGPAYYSPYKHLDRAVERQHWVLKKMVENGYIAEAEAKEAEAQPIRLAPPQNVMTKAPFFTDFVKAELIRKLKAKMSEADIPIAGFRVYSTIDLSLNQLAQQVVATGVADVEKRFKLPPTQRLESALATVDPATGYIRALVGGRNYAQSNFNRILNMKRQVGSTFKPFVYLAALLKGDDPNGVPYGPAHPAEDAPWTLEYDKGRQTWSPKNYEKEFLGWIDYRKALAHSINTVAAKVGWEVGLDNVIKVARTLGIESDLPTVPSLTLGVSELSPIELLRAYTTLADHGRQGELMVIRGITLNDGTRYEQFLNNKSQIIPSGAADVMTDMLQSVFTEGTAKFARFDRPAAGKTGTTSHHRDAWFAGYTPQLATVVWVGLDADTPEAKTKSKLNLTGATAALPIWADFMKKALADEPPTPFPVGAEVVDVPIDKYTGLRAQRDCPAGQTIVDKYIKGGEPKRESCENLWPKSVPRTVE